MINYHENNFTPVRLALALLVVLGHFVTLPGDAPAHGLFNYADFAVDAFFVVSGYLIYASFDNLPLPVGFYIRRLFRIYPLYLAVVLAQGLIMAALAGGITSHMESLLHYMLLNMVMANFLAYDIDGLLGGLHNPGINPSLWTLKIELAFYIVLPLLWVLTRRLGGLFLMVLYVSSVAFAAVAQQHGLDNLGRQLPGQMRFFAIGMALYYYRDRLNVHALPLAIAAGLSLALCKTYPDLPGTLAVFPLCAGLIVYLCVFRLPQLPLSFDISYGVYLLHAPLIQLALLLGMFRDSWDCVLFLLANVLVLAFFAERLIEQPGIALGKRLSRIWAKNHSTPETV